MAEGVVWSGLFGCDGVMLPVRLGCLFGVVFGVEVVGMGEMSMMAGVGVLAGLVMLGGLTMVLSRLLMMLGRLRVMFSGAFRVLRHYQPPCYASDAGVMPGGDDRTAMLLCSMDDGC
jgi:hypothetical protein